MRVLQLRGMQSVCEGGPATYCLWSHMISPEEFYAPGRGDECRDSKEEHCKAVMYMRTLREFKQRNLTTVESQRLAIVLMTCRLQFLPLPYRSHVRELYTDGDFVKRERPRRQPRKTEQAQGFSNQEHLLTFVTHAPFFKETPPPSSHHSIAPCPSSRAV